jgi:hypothetical protein
MATDEKKKKSATPAAWRKRAAAVGAMLALVCHLLPEEYREVCRALAAVCTGGSL